jgi:23S rRNA (guanosine2251-2'-O)-methyltransferase
MKNIIGRKPALEAIKSGEAVTKIYLLHGQKGEIIDEIKRAAAKKDIPISEIPADRFAKYTNQQNSQGVVAFLSEQKNYQIDEIIDAAKKSRYPLILALDTIQDTHNLGAILRTAECCGVDGIILTRHNSAPINETVYKTSAGAVNHLKICTVNNLSQALDQLKREEFWIIGSSLQDSKEYAKVDYKMPVVLVLGNEEKGIRRLTAEKCDILVRIPMKGEIQSLNVSVAAGILMFETLRQRGS